MSNRYQVGKYIIQIMSWLDRLAFSSQSTWEFARHVGAVLADLWPWLVQHTLAEVWFAESSPHTVTLAMTIRLPEAMTSLQRIEDEEEEDDVDSGWWGREEGRREGGKGGTSPALQNLCSISADAPAFSLCQRKTIIIILPIPSLKAKKRRRSQPSEKPMLPAGANKWEEAERLRRWKMKSLWEEHTNSFQRDQTSANRWAPLNLFTVLILQ